MAVEFITIHHKKLKAEARSTEEALKAKGGLGSKGWTKGKLPKAAAKPKKPAKG